MATPVKLVLLLAGAITTVFSSGFIDARIHSAGKQGKTFLIGLLLINLKKKNNNV